MEKKSCKKCHSTIREGGKHCTNCGEKYVEPLGCLESLSALFTFLAPVVLIIVLSVYYGLGGFLMSIPLALVLFVVLLVIATKFSKRIKNIDEISDDIYSERLGENGDDSELDKKKTNMTLEEESSFALKKELEEREKVIADRKKELKEDKEKVLKVLQKVSSREQSEKWKKVGSFLSESLQTLNRHEVEYELRAIEIKSIRLQNDLSPFISNFDTVSFEQVDRYLDKLPAMKILSEEIVEEAKEVGKPIEGTPSYKDFLDRISATTASIVKLQDGYLTKQAALALRDVSSDDSLEDMMLLDTKSAIQNDVFNIQASITDFSHAFDELEVEYMRVRDEDEISTQLKEITKKI